MAAVGEALPHETAIVAPEPLEAVQQPEGYSYQHEDGTKVYAADVTTVMSECKGMVGLSADQVQMILRISARGNAVMDREEKQAENTRNVVVEVSKRPPEQSKHSVQKIDTVLPVSKTTLPVGLKHDVGESKQFFSEQNGLVPPAEAVIRIVAMHQDEIITIDVDTQQTDKVLHKPFLHQTTEHVKVMTATPEFRAPPMATAHELEYRQLAHLRQLADVKPETDVHVMQDRVSPYEIHASAAESLPVSELQNPPEAQKSMPFITEDETVKYVINTSEIETPELPVYETMSEAPDAHSAVFGKETDQPLLIESDEDVVPAYHELVYEHELHVSDKIIENIAALLEAQLEPEQKTVESVPQFVFSAVETDDTSYGNSQIFTKLESVEATDTDVVTLETIRQKTQEGLPLVQAVTEVGTLLTSGDERSRHDVSQEGPITVDQTESGVPVVKIAVVELYEAYTELQNMSEEVPEEYEQAKFQFATKLAVFCKVLGYERPDEALREFLQQSELTKLMQHIERLYRLLENEERKEVLLDSSLATDTDAADRPAGVHLFLWIGRALLRPAQNLTLV